MLYLLTGIGILVEILRRLGFAFVTARAHQATAPAAGCVAGNRNLNLASGRPSKAVPAR
jgi:hypothetical protein